MGFEDLLKRRLGPMKDLLTRSASPLAPQYDPESLYYRRALGLEFCYQPEQSRAKVLVEISGRAQLKLNDKEACQLCALNHWRLGGAIEGLSSKKLWQWAQKGLLNFSRTQPKGGLSTGVVTDSASALRLRRGAWPYLALEDLVQIRPVPFMPRRSDLEFSELVGMRFAVVERGFDVMGVSITGSEKLGRALRDLLPRLNGRESWDQLADSLDVLAVNLLTALKKFGLLSNDPRPSESLSRWATTDKSQVTWLGHASVLIQTRGVNILVDPLFFAASDPPSPKHRDRPFDPLQLPPIDAVLITHGDNDHFNPNSLAFLPRTTRVIVPRLAEPPAPYHVDIRNMLKRLGFEKVIEMAPWSNVAINGLTVTACPFEGENWGLELPQLTYLVYSDALSVYCSADSHVMSETFERIKADRPRVDIAFMGVTGCAEPHAVDARLGYGNFYRDWIPKVQHNEWIQHCMGPEDVCEMLKIFEPRFAFGYAAGGADFIQTSFSDVGSHEELAGLLEASNAVTRPLQMPLNRPIKLSGLETSSVPMRKENADPCV